MSYMPWLASSSASQLPTCTQSIQSTCQRESLDHMTDLHLRWLLSCPHIVRRSVAVVAIAPRSAYCSRPGWRGRGGERLRGSFVVIHILVHLQSPAASARHAMHACKAVCTGAGLAPALRSRKKVRERFVKAAISLSSCSKSGRSYRAYHRSITLRILGISGNVTLHSFCAGLLACSLTSGSIFQQVCMTLYASVEQSDGRSKRTPWVNFRCT